MSVVPHPTHPGWWHIKYYPHGKKGGLKVIVIQDSTHAEALRFEAELRRQSTGGVINSEFPTIREAIPYYLKYYQLEHLPGGYDAVQRYMARWGQIIGKLKFAAINTAMIESYKHRRLSEGIKPTSINKELSALSGLLKWGIEKGYCRELKIKRFPNKMTKSPLPDVPTREEVLALIDCMIWPRCGLFACMYYAGLRAGEASTMTVDKVHLDHGVIIVRGKGNKERPVPVVEMLRPFLEKRLSEISRGLMWPTREGKMVTDFKKIIHWARLRAGLTRHFYPHLLRHAFGTHATQSGVNLRTLQYAMGHTTSKTTEIYTTLSGRAIIDEVIGKFGKV